MVYIAGRHDIKAVNWGLNLHRSIFVKPFIDFLHTIHIVCDDMEVACRLIISWVCDAFDDYSCICFCRYILLRLNHKDVIIDWKTCKYRARANPFTHQLQWSQNNSLGYLYFNETVFGNHTIEIDSELVFGSCPRSNWICYDDLTSDLASCRHIWAIRSAYHVRQETFSICLYIKIACLSHR